MNLHVNVSSRDSRMAQSVIADGALGADEYNVELDEWGQIRISPTVVSQFIRLDEN